LLGSFSAYKSGHALNNQLIRQLMSNHRAWEFATFEHEEEAPQVYAPAIADTTALQFI